MSTPTEVVSHMMEHDLFSQWLGIQVLEVKEGYSKIKMTVRKEMINGFGIVHGGIAFSLADSAFAFACNSHGILTLALAADISFTRQARAGDILTVEASMVHRGGRTGVYEVRVTNTAEELVALFKGTAYQTSKPLDVQ